MTFTLNSSALTNRFNIRRTLRFWNDLIFLNKALIKRTGLTHFDNKATSVSWDSSVEMYKSQLG